MRRADERLLEVHRVVDDRHQRELIAMPDEMLRHRRLGTCGNAVPLDDAVFHVRRRDRQAVALDLARGEAFPQVLGIRRGMRPSVHPDDPVVATEHAFERVRDELVGDRIDALR